VESTSFVAFSCPHCPLQDEGAVEWLIERVASIRPDVLVHLGDGLEADSASRWPTEYPWSLADEFAEHERFLKRLRKASPRSRRVFLPGNHEDNLLSINRIDRRLRGLCDYRSRSNCPELAEHWEQPVPYVFDRRAGVFKIGQVSFSHGFESGARSDESQAILLGQPFGLMVTGHTHRPTPGVMRAMRTQTIPLPYWYANPGCLRDLKPDYMRRKRSHAWGHGLVTGRASPVRGGRLSRMWEATVEVFRLSDDGEIEV
jgi:predicted phosphodiesterase